MPKFKLVDAYRYWWPVKVQVPDPANPGKIVPQSFEMEFEAMPLEEAQALDREFRALKTAEERASHETEMLKRVCRNWRGVEAEGGGEQPFDPEALERALRFGWFRTGCYRAYGQSIDGDEARMGN